MTQLQQQYEKQHDPRTRHQRNQLHPANAWAVAILQRRVASYRQSQRAGRSASACSRVKEAVIIVLLGVLVMAYAASLCDVGEFKILAQTTNDPTVRKDVTLKWMKAHAKDCSNPQLVAMYNHLAEWLGAADNFEIRGLIYEHYRTEK